MRKAAHCTRPLSWTRHECGESSIEGLDNVELMTWRVTQDVELEEGDSRTDCRRRGWVKGPGKGKAQPHGGVVWGQDCVRAAQSVWLHDVHVSHPSPRIRACTPVCTDAGGVAKRFRARESSHQVAITATTARPSKSGRYHSEVFGTP